MSLWSEFKAFLDEYKVLGLAVAFIMGLAATSLVKSMVDDMIMPFVAIILPKSSSWQTASWNVTMPSPLHDLSLGWGPFLSQLVNFVILAFVVFLIAKYVLREQKVTKK